MIQITIIESTVLEKCVVTENIHIGFSHFAMLNSIMGESGGIGGDDSSFVIDDDEDEPRTGVRS